MAALLRRLIWLALIQVPYSRFAYIAQAIFVIVLCYWFRALPPPGYAVATLGLAAAVIAIRGTELTRAEAAVWLIIASAMCGLEMTAIYTDRAQQEIQHMAELNARDLQFVEMITDVRGLHTDVDAFRKTNEIMGARLEKKIAEIRHAAPPNGPKSLKERGLEAAQVVTNFISSRSQQFPSRAPEGPGVPAEIREERDLVFARDIHKFDGDMNAQWESDVLPRIMPIVRELQDAKVMRPGKTTCEIEPANDSLAKRIFFARDIEMAASHLK
jgi:hypothetical protein